MKKTTTIIAAAVIILVGGLGYWYQTPAPSIMRALKASDKISPDAVSRSKITHLRTDGDFALFGIEDPELDPAFGYAKKENGKWIILNLGTGGDPTEFYNQYNIPQSLRDN